MKNNDPAVTQYAAERAFAVIGARAVVSREVEKLTADKRKRIEAYDKIIAAHAKALINDEIKCTWPVVPDYDPILADLSQPLNEAQLHDMIEPLPTDVQSDFTTMAHKLYGFLLAALPKNFAKTYAGGTNLPIDDPSWFKFCNLLRVLDDPLQVFELISAAALTKAQTSAVQMIYPIISTKMQIAIQSAVTDARAKSPKKDPYELPFKSEQGLKTLLGLPITVPSYQEIFVKPDNTEDKEQEPSRSQLDPGAELSLTSAQQLSYPKA